ncbi:MAG: hypothetical protein J5486_06565 [Bacteroidaceae bacterium]|nr:hypothetical protein [Bacteroidaceae bacterium]
MKKTYITPMAEQLQTQVQTMLALSLINENATADGEVLVKEDNNWDIWGEEE